MQRWVLVVLVTSACGRENFDDARLDGITGGGDTRDEDADGIANATDNCPVSFNDSQADQDGDGVGDACDPRPTTGGDRIAAVGFFEDSFGDWVPNAGSEWAFGGGVATTTAPTDSTLTSISFTGNAPNPTAQVSVRVLEYLTGNDSIELGITDTTSGGLWTCRLDDNAGSSGSEFDRLVMLEQATGRVASDLPGQLLVGSTIRLRTAWDGTTLGCLANSTPLTFGTGAQSPPKAITLTARTLKLALDHAVVYVHD